VEDKDPVALLMMSSVPREATDPRRRFEYPLIGGPNGARVIGAEVEFDARTRRELLGLLRDIEVAQMQTLSPSRRHITR